MKKRTKIILIIFIILLAVKVSLDIYGDAVEKKEKQILARRLCWVHT